MKYCAPFVSHCTLRIHRTLKYMHKDVSLPPASRVNILSIATIKSSQTVLLFELVLLHHINGIAVTGVMRYRVNVLLAACRSSCSAVE